MRAEACRIHRDNETARIEMDERRQYVWWLLFRAGFGWCWLEKHAERGIRGCSEDLHGNRPIRLREYMGDSRICLQEVVVDGTYGSNARSSSLLGACSDLHSENLAPDIVMEWLGLCKQTKMFEYRPRCSRTKLLLV
jgi:hypothetical protein